MQTARKIPVILLSGMGADARVFARQMESLPSLVVPAWIAPLPRESLRSYAARLAAVVDPGEPCLIGGASFGGFVAVEMAKHVDAKACLLVGSVRAPAELPAHIRAFRRAAPAAGAIPFEVATLLSKAALLSGGRLLSRQWPALLEQMTDSDAAFLRWACGAVLSWQGDPDVGRVPIHQIHGDRDLVLPIKNTRPDCVVPGGGHAISLSHPDEVTAFLARMVDTYEGEQVGPRVTGQLPDCADADAVV